MYCENHYINKYELKVNLIDNPGFRPTIYPRFATEAVYGSNQIINHVTVVLLCSYGYISEITLSTEKSQAFIYEPK